MLRFVLFIVQLMLVSVMLSGCVLSSSSSEDRWSSVTRNDGNQVHVVKWGDETLPAIAKWYTGSSENWDAIANANPTVDPLHVQQGDHVFIPHGLLKTRGGMTRTFLDTFLLATVSKVAAKKGLAVEKTIRILAPTPYKKKKTDEDSSGRKGESVASSQPQPEATPEPSPQEGTDLILFGPR